MRLVCSGWRACSGGLGSVVLDRGGGESARAKGGGWESVVEDGEVVVGWPTVCARSGKPGKKRRRSTRRCVHTKQTWTIAEYPGVRRTPRCVFWFRSHFMRPTGSNTRPVTAHMSTSASARLIQQSR